MKSGRFWWMYREREEALGIGHQQQGPSRVVRDLPMHRHDPLGARSIVGEPTADLLEGPDTRAT